MQGLLTNPNFWAAFSAVASALSAMAALVVVLQTAHSHKRELEGKRAYLRVVSDVMEFSGDGTPRMRLKVSNVGSHPAKNIQARMVIANLDGFGESLSDREFAISNELVHGGELDCMIPASRPTPMDTPRQLVSFVVQYSDAVLNQAFEQHFYFEWAGVVNGALSPTLTHGLMDRERAQTLFQERLGLGGHKG